MSNPELPFEDRPPEEGFSLIYAIELVNSRFPHLSGAERHEKIDEIAFDIEDCMRTHDEFMMAEMKKPAKLMESEIHGQA